MSIPKPFLYDWTVRIAQVRYVIGATYDYEFLKSAEFGRPPGMRKSVTSCSSNVESGELGMNEVNLVMEGVISYHKWHHNRRLYPNLDMILETRTVDKELTHCLIFFKKDFITKLCLVIIWQMLTFYPMQK